MDRDELRALSEANDAPSASPALLLSRIAGLAAVYFITGRLGLELAIPPGYATAIWPPSGIALAAILLYGRGLWPGILLGSFLINVPTGFDSTTFSLAARSVAIPLAIGGGASLQAVIGDALIRRFGNFPNRLIEAKQIGLLLVLGGVVACLTNASIGIGLLTAVGTVSLANAPFSWATWWAGDCIGVFVFTPIIVSWLATPRQLWTKRRVPTTVSLAITLTLTILVVGYTASLERRSFQSIVDERMAVLATELQKTLARYGDAVRSTEGFFAGRSDPDSEGFSLFAARILETVPGVQALEWVPRIARQDRPAFEAMARRRGDGNFEITELAAGQSVRAGEREDYYPVSLCEPKSGSETIIGFDAGSTSDGRNTLTAAIRTGRLAVSRKITLAEGVGNRTAVLAFAPIFRRSKGRGESAQNPKDLQGFAVGVIRLQPLVENAFQGLNLSGIRFWLTDETESDSAILLTNSKDPPGVLRLHEHGLFGGTISLGHRADFEFGGRRWVLWADPSQIFIAAYRLHNAWSVLVFGMLFSSLLAAFVMTLSGREEALVALVEERSTDLRRALADLIRSNRALDEFASVASHDLKAPLRGIFGLANWIAEDLGPDVDPETRDKLSRMAILATRLQRMIDGLLQYSRVAAPGSEPEDIDLNELIDEIITTLSPPRGMVVKVLGILPTIRSNKAAIEQVLRNLVGNAIHHHDQESGTISVQVTDAGERIAFKIEDDGPGIAPRHHARIFELLQTLKPRDRVEGSGIGLAVVKRLVLTHGGEIRVESAPPHRGSAFVFTWPKHERRAFVRGEND